MRAKMQVDQVTATTYSDEVKMSAVCGKSPEDNSFAQATPAGSLSLSINNPQVRGTIKPGQKFYVDFTEATE